MKPSAILYTRQQIAELTGLPADTLNYWMRENVLRPSEGGEGRGSHRRFPYWEVNLAAILKEIAQFGTSLSSLKMLADAVHASIDWTASHGMEPYEPRLLKFIQENRASFDRHGYCSAPASEFPGREVMGRSSITGEDRVHLDWPETVQWMKQSPFYRNEIGARFEDRHFELAETLDPGEVERHWLTLYRFVSILRDRPTNPLPSYYYRDAAGEWTIAGYTAQVRDAPYSSIAINDGTLVYDLWNGREAE